MRADAMQKRIEAMLADRTTGYAGVFKALLSAAVRRASGSAAAAADIALAPGFMAALSLAFDEAAQSGSVCVRFGAIEGALALFRIMSLEGGQLVMLQWAGASRHERPLRPGPDRSHYPMGRVGGGGAPGIIGSVSPAKGGAPWTSRA